jgi:hypothetical protein
MRAATSLVTIPPVANSEPAAVVDPVSTASVERSCTSGMSFALGSFCNPHVKVGSARRARVTGRNRDD